MRKTMLKISLNSSEKFKNITAPANLIQFDYFSCRINPLELKFIFQQIFITIFQVVAPFSKHKGPNYVIYSEIGLYTSFISFYMMENVWEKENSVCIT